MRYQRAFTGCSRISKCAVPVVTFPNDVPPAIGLVTGRYVLAGMVTSLPNPSGLMFNFGRTKNAFNGSPQNATNAMSHETRDILDLLGVVGTLAPCSTGFRGGDMAR